MALYRAPPRRQLLGYASNPVRDYGERFASAAQGRVLAGCCTGLAPTPGSLGNRETVLLPVFAFSMQLLCSCCDGECTGHFAPLSTRMAKTTGTGTRDGPRTEAS